MADKYLGGLFSNLEETPVFIDGDTFVSPTDERHFRIGGMDTPEVTKVIDDKLYEGDVGGSATASVLSALAKKDGFNILEDSGQTDKYGRSLGDLRNSQGESLRAKALESGLAAPTHFSTAEDINSVMIGRLNNARAKADGTQDEWQIAGEQMQSYIGANSSLKPMVVDEQEYAAIKDYYGSDREVNRYLSPNVQFRRSDRTLDNKAASTLKTSWAMAKLGFQESAWGALDLVSDIFGYENTGHDNVLGKQALIADLPILDNQNAFDKDGNWRIDSVGSFGEFILTNAVISSPYLVTTALASFATPLIAVPSMIYAGQTYNEMPEDNKNPVLAMLSGVGQAVLDRVGLESILKGKSFPAGELWNNRTLRTQAAKEMVEAGLQPDMQAALDILNKAMQQELKIAAGAMKNGIASNLKSKYFLDGAGGAILKGTAGEAITEVMQETIGYAAANNLNFSEMDLAEYQNRIMNAGVAGGVLGGVFSTGSQGLQAFNRYSAYRASQEANKSAASSDLQRQDALKEQGQDTSIWGVIKRTAASKLDEKNDLASIAKAETDRRKTKGVLGKAWEFVRDRGLRGLWEGNLKEIDNRFGHIPSIAAALGLLGGNSVYSDGNIETAQHQTDTGLRSRVGSEAEALERFKVRDTDTISNIMNAPAVQELDTKLRDRIQTNNSLNTFEDAYKDIGSPEIDTTVDMKLILDYLNRAYDFDKKRAELMKGDINKLNMWKDKTWDKLKIDRNKSKFIDTLIDELKMNRGAAEDFTNRLLEQEDASIVNDDMLNKDLSADDIFGMLTGVENITSISKEKLASVPKLQEFFNSNMFYNVAGLSGATSSAWANSNFLGTNGSRLAQLINEAGDSLSAEDKAYLAAEFMDVMAIRKQKWNEIKNPTVKALQQNVLMLSATASLPLATVSAIVEVANTAYNVPRDILYKQLPKMVTAWAGETFDYVSQGVTAATNGRVNRKTLIDWDSKDPDPRKDLYAYGFEMESQSAAQKYDVKLNNFHQKFMNGFFKLIGLQGITNVSRAFRLATAADTIYGLIQDVLVDGNGPRSVQGQQAREMLIHLGVDVDYMVDLYNKNAYEGDPRFEEQMKLATFNFVNDAIAHPTKGNRPKFYNNPKLALFFQFQGFISTFTSTILPRLYNQVAGRGQIPAARAEAVRNILTLLFFGYLSTVLRDTIKNGGKIPDEDDLTMRLRRAVNSSGVLGVGERVVNRLFPLYPERSSNVFEATAQVVAGEAPALNWSANVATALTDIFDFEESGREWQKAAKVAPLTGPFHQSFKESSDSFVRKAIDDLF